MLEDLFALALRTWKSTSQALTDLVLRQPSSYVDGSVMTTSTEELAQLVAARAHTL